jgi:hypothetical protein
MQLTKITHQIRWMLNLQWLVVVRVVNFSEAIKKKLSRLYSKKKLAVALPPISMII